MNKSTRTLLIVFFTVLVGSALLVYLLMRGSSPVADDNRAATAETRVTATPESTAPASGNGANTIITELFGSDSTSPPAPEEGDRGVVALRIFLRFLLAAILSTFLAYRWRRGVPLTSRNPYVAQTQILLAVVAAAMMMVVGDSAARAFGIFAAASLVRFRTNIRDPKETTVLLICLGVGLACGVGRLDMAAILTVFVLVALWIMEHFESAQIFRAMEVSVGTRNLDQTLQVLKNLFEKHEFTAELRQLNREEDEGASGKIVYGLSMGTAVSVDALTEELFAQDASNITSLEWDQKKSSTYIYR